MATWLYVHGIATFMPIFSVSVLFFFRLIPAFEDRIRKK
jgi:hypothetical protein